MPRWGYPATGQHRFNQDRSWSRVPLATLQGDKGRAGRYTSSTMLPDDEICVCFGVSLRKLVNYAQRVRPTRSSQMTGCLSAGTGCGWCIPHLITIAKDPDAFELDNMTAEQYAAQRKSYIAKESKHAFE